MEEKNPLATTALSSAEPSAGNVKAVDSQSIGQGRAPITADKNVILVVDDSADNVAILSLDLQQMGYRAEGFKRAAYDAGVSGYLTKPIDFDRMHQLIARLLAAGIVGSLGGK